MLVPPAIITSPGNVVGVEGEPVTMKCEASGLPKPKYEFIKVLFVSFLIEKRYMHK